MTTQTLSDPSSGTQPSTCGQAPVARTFEDRAYQQQATNDLRDALRDLNSVILYAPTGSGKTKIACDITAKAVQRKRRVLFMGDSTEIIEQTAQTMTECGVSFGIIQAGRQRDLRPWESVHIGTIQTLRNRNLPPKDLVWVDECHLSRAKSWHEVIQHYVDAGAKVVGLSATPCRLDGKGLGKLFQKIVYCPSIEQLTAAGYLCPVRIFAPPAPKVAEVKTVAGDFNKAQLAAVMDKAKLIGDAVEHYGRMARGRLAILSASSIEHSKHLASAFNAAGVPAAHCDGDTPAEERRRILKSLPAREIMVLCQVDICGKGWDCREVSAGIDCRPTQSLSRWLQFVGRILRTAEGKRDAILLDHSGNVHRFGFPDEERAWSLDEAATKKRDKDAAPPVTTCKQCFATFRPGPSACPYCGAAIEKQERRIDVEEGALEELVRERKMLAVEEWRTGVTGEKRRLHFEELSRLGNQRGYKPGWARVKFKAIYGEWAPAEWHGSAVEDPGYANPAWNEAVQTLLACAPKAGGRA